MSLKARKEKLKNDVISVLSQHTEGVHIIQLWQLVRAKTGREICAQDYGITKLSKILKEWTDVIEVYEVDKCRLKNLGPIHGKQSLLENKANKVPSWGIDEFPPLTGSDCSHLKSKKSNTQSGTRKSGGKAVSERPGFASQENPQQSVQKPSKKLNAKSLKSEISCHPITKKTYDFGDLLAENASSKTKQSQACANVNLAHTSNSKDFYECHESEESSRPEMMTPILNLKGHLHHSTTTSLPVHVQGKMNTSMFSQHGVVPSAVPVAQPGPITNPTYVNLSSEPLLQGSRDAVKNVVIEPMNKREFEHKDIDVRRVYLPKGKNPPPDYVDNLAKECIEKLAEANLYVSPERVEKLVCKSLGFSNVRQIGFQYIDHVPCVNELNRQICKINTYILAFVKTRSICTLHELKEALREYEPNKEDFVNLKVGPLQSFPVVYEQFKFPPDQAEIPEITSIDILEHFHVYITKNQLWSKKIELEPFMDYLVDQYNVDNGYMLGVRIRSLLLAVSVLKKAQRDEGNNRREIVEHFKENLKTEIDDAFRKFRANILQTGSSEGMEVRAHYLKMRPELAITEIFEKFNMLISLVQLSKISHIPFISVVQSSQISHVRATRLSKAIQEFIKVVQNDELGKSLLHLAICITNTTLEQSAMKLLDPPPAMLDNEDIDGDQIQRNKIKPPSKGLLVESIKKYIEKCLNAGALSLTQLHKIEERLLEDFSFQAFHMMGFGTFLEFLLTEAKQMLEESGGLALGTGSENTADGDVSFKPHQADILEFIAQCKQNGLIQATEIEEALCKQYHVNEVRHLGHGNIARLLHFQDKHGKHKDGVFYQSALLQPIGLHCTSGSKVGILGHQTKDAAKICLHNCPLLENLADWSQWYLVFEPELGNLKDFIQKNVNATIVTMEGGRLATLDFMALEVKPGELLKIVSSTSLEHVTKALEQRDVIGICGHLVSMAVDYKGINKLPMALLSGHVKTILLQMHAESPEDEIDQNVAAMFVLQCLLRIPTKFCVALANQVFLDPLGQVVGSTKSKQLLLRLCKTVRELNHLTELGCLLGIQEWTNLTQQRCVPPDSAIEILTPDVKEFLQNENLFQLQENEEETECSDDTEVDFDEILAGEDIDKINDKLQVHDIDEEKNEADTVVIIESNKEKEQTDTFENDDVITDDVKVSGIPSCEDIVNQICKDEFGVGVHLNEDGHRLMKVQQDRLGRSLDRLSKDLYSKDTHFVLELIQNADDNTYHDDLLNNTKGECPSVKFIIDTESIQVMNNEMGFQERHIRALCDVGKSTKGKHKFGYIGQKGIGFKSVFRVTDVPEVHSNGYHIKFDVNSGPMGYIQPNWIPESEQPNNNSWMTQIILKLKIDDRVQTRTLAARFNDIHPSLLLFLHRLRQITIENKVENTVQTMRRRDVGNDIIEIENSDICERWLVIKKTLDASKISLQAKSGADVESTEIALAFPIRSQGQKAFVQILPPKQPVFAFLPLRSYGFRFIIQGDFDVPSSREDVDRDSVWNQWLRNEIHTLFIDALDIFKRHPEFTAMEAVCMFLQFVPMEDEVLDFFKPVSTDILKKLKARPCVPTQPNSQGIVSWKMPSQTVRARDPRVRTVITSDLLQKHLNLYYLHSDVAEIINPTLTSCLGIETLTSEHLYQLGNALIVQIGTHCKNNDDVILISKWLACMYISLNECHNEDTILTKLKSLQMLPLSDGELVSLHDRTVFFPITDSVANSQKDSICFLQQDINSLHPMLLASGDDEVNIQVRKLLLRLGIKQCSPIDIINRHIIPILNSDSWKSKPEGALITYLTYIKEQTDKDASVCNLDELRSIAVVKTKQGFKIPSKEPVHFPPQYGNKINLQQMFSGYNWTFLDTVYLPKSCPQSVITSYHNFFVKLGVEDCLSVRQKKVHLQKEDLKTSPWCILGEMWPKEETEFIVEDYYSPELEGLIKDNKTPNGDLYINQMRCLCTYLDSQWESKFSKYCVACVKNKEGKPIKDTETSLSILLHTAAWLPAVEIQSQPDGNAIKYERHIVMKQPASLYIKSDTISRLLSDKVLYLDITPIGGLFTQYLGLKYSVAIDTVKDHLLQWGKRATPDVPAVFCTSLQHIKNVYVYLCENLNPKQIQELLRENVYFVPNSNSAHFLKSDEVCAGKMLGRNEIWLADKTGLFDKYKKLLEDFHSEICHKRMIASFYKDTPVVQNNFRKQGKVDKQPNVHEYIELLVLLCSIGPPKDSQILSDVLCIFTTIGQTLSTSPDGMPDDRTAHMALDAMKSSVKEKLKKQKVFPTKKLTWVSLEEHPMIVDNNEWEKMFANKDGVHFLGSWCQIPPRLPVKAESHIQPHMIARLLEICEVKKLSEVVKITPVTDIIKPCVPLQKYFHQIVPCVQQFIKARFLDVYQQLEYVNIQATLKAAQFFKADKLEVTYRLSNMEKETFEIKEEKCVIEAPIFYFQSEHLSAFAEINREVARYFSNGNPECFTVLRGFLSEFSTLFGKTEDLEEDVENLLRSHEAGDTVIDPEEMWHVKAPLIVETKPELVPDMMLEDKSLIVPEQKSDTNDGPLELKAWPPVSNESRSQTREKSDQPASNIWPPPQAKDYMRSIKDLPSNIRFVVAGETDKTCVDERGDSSDNNNSASGQTRVVCPGQNVNNEHGHDGPDLKISRRFHGQDASKTSMYDPPGPGEHANDKKHETSKAGPADHSVVHAMGESGQVQVTMATKDSDGLTAAQVNSLSAQRDIYVLSSRHLQHTGNGTHQHSNIHGKVVVVSYDDFVRLLLKVTTYKGNPKWTQLASEYTFDDLELGVDIKMPAILNLKDDIDNHNIGYWGEALVAEYLTCQKNIGKVIDFTWKNKSMEAGSPYDFEVCFADNDGSHVHYIEVKSTVSDNKEMFEISVQQIKFADEKKDNFHIYRVFNAGNTERVRLVRINNLDLRLSQKQVKLCMMI